MYVKYLLMASVVRMLMQRFRIFIALVSMAFIAGCISTSPIQYSSNNDAKKSYLAGEQYLNDGLYDLAIPELKKSIAIDKTPFLPHAKLAVSYYAKKDYINASISFRNATIAAGGEYNSGPIPIFEALSLMRSGKNDEARKLLDALTGPDIVVTPTGSFTAKSGRAGGVWKTAANYLLSRVELNEYLSQVPQDDPSFHYLIIGIEMSLDGDRESAYKYLGNALKLAGRGTWRSIIAFEEFKQITD